MFEKFLKYLYGGLSDEERNAFLHEVNADNKQKEKFAEYQNLHALLNLGKQLEDREEGMRKYQCFEQKVRRKQIFIKGIQYMKYAAVIFVLLTFSSLTTFYIVKQNQPALAVTQNILHTPAGQRAQLTLQDGTTVWLNANSTLTYPSLFTGKERRVQVQGEAFFNVAKDASKPFIVSSGKVEMEVLGTQFNVKNYPQEESLRTSLLEGSIRVYCPESDTKGVILEPKQQVTVSEGRMVVSKFYSDADFLWREGIYAFENEPLENILNKLELYYDVDIQVESPGILNGSYTGKFRQRDSLDDIFRILQQINWFKVEKSENNSVIILKK